MAYDSQSSTSSNETAIPELPQEAVCELMNVQSADNCGQSACFETTFSNAGFGHEKLCLESASGEHSKEAQIISEIGRNEEIGLEGVCLVGTPGTTSKEQSTQWNETEVYPEENWRLINFEPSVQSDLVCSEGDTWEDFSYLDQPGPSRGKSHNSYSFAFSVQEPTNEWKETSVEQCYSLDSSRKKQSSKDIPGPSRIKAHGTILKKSADKPPQGESTSSALPEQGQSTRDSHKNLNSPDYSPQLIQPLKQCGEKENQKRVHFEQKSECELLSLCDRECMGHSTKCPSATQFTTLSGDDDNLDAEESLLIESTRDALHSHILQRVENKENSKGMDKKSTLHGKISIAVNENASANNNKPMADEPVSTENVPGYENDEAETTHQPIRKMENKSLVSEGESFGQSSNSSKPERSSRISSDVGQTGSDIVAHPETPLYEADCNTLVDRADQNQRGHTEKMVALFTDLQVKQSSPPMPSDKSKRVKPLGEKIADFVQCYDERIARNVDKQTTVITSNKLEKSQTQCNTKSSTNLLSSNPEIYAKTSRKLVQKLEVHKDKTRMLNTSKQSVEAVLLVLHSMQSILVRMARIASSKIFGNAEKDEFPTDPLERRRKKQPWESVCPKDSEVTPDGLFAYNIAHQVIGQAFKKISELYPSCANWKLRDSASEKEFVDRNSASVILALTAMKDALRELEGPAMYKFYTSTAVETSDSLTSVSMENVLNEQGGIENIGESKSVVLDILSEVIECVAKGSTEIYSDRNKTDQKQSLNTEDNQDDNLNRELKRISYELVSRTVREAVSGLLKSKAQSMSDTSCDRTRSLPVQNIDTKTRTPSDTKTVVNTQCSTTTSENTEKDDQSVASLVQSISNVIHDLISKLFCHLESTDCREKLDLLITEIGKDLSTSADTEYNTCSPLSKQPYTTQRKEEKGSYWALKSVKLKHISREDTTDSSTDGEYVSDSKIRTVEQSDFLESQQSSSDAAHLCGSIVQEEHPPIEKSTLLCTSEKESERNHSGEVIALDELCQSNESMKCMNSSSQTRHSSVENLFDMVLENSSCRMTSENRFMDDTHSQELFEYSTPSTLLGWNGGQNSRDGNMLQSLEFGHLHIMVQSSDRSVTPTTLLQMSGGNHPEHVQQADQNRPSCSQCSHGQNSPNVSEKVVLSRSTTTSKNKKEAGSWNSCSPWHHQTRPSNFLGSSAVNKQSNSEPELDFYKRTKVADSPPVQKQLPYSAESDLSEWFTFSYYPPRCSSKAAAPSGGEHEEENTVPGADVDEDVCHASLEMKKMGGSCSVENADSQTAKSLNDKDEPGCLSTDTDVSIYDLLGKQHSGSDTVDEKASQSVTNVENTELEYFPEENDISSTDQSTSKDTEGSVLNEQELLWQDQGRMASSFEKQKHVLDNDLCEQAPAICQFSSIDGLPPKMPCPSRSHSVSKVHSACEFGSQRLELSSVSQKREVSSVYSNDHLQLQNQHKHFAEKPYRNLTLNQYSSPLISIHSNNDLKVLPENIASQPKQMHESTKTHHPFAYLVPQSSCCSSPISPTEFEEGYVWCRRHGNEDCRASSTEAYVDDIYNHTDMNSQALGASAWERCASLDSQLQNNNQNINGIGRKPQDSASKIGTPSTISAISGQDSMVDRVHDKFSQLQSQLNMGVDSLKDYITALCSSLENDQTAGKEMACKELNQHPVHRPSCSSCCSSSPPPCFPPPSSQSISDRGKSCSYHHPPPVGVVQHACCISPHERPATQCCEERRAVSPEMYYLCQDFHRYVHKCRCCSGQRHSQWASQRSSPLTDNCMEEGGHCQALHAEFKASSSPSSSITGAIYPQRACTNRPTDSTLRPHSSPCHCVLQERLHIVPEIKEQQTPPPTEVESDWPDHCSRHRVCHISRARSHRVKKSSPFQARDRSNASSVYVSEKDSRSSLESCNIVVGNEKEKAPASDECEHSIPMSEEKQKQTLYGSRQNERPCKVPIDQSDLDRGAENSGASSIEIAEQNNDRGTKANGTHLHGAIDSNHRCGMTRISPSVLDTAVSIVKTLLTMQNSQAADLQEHLVPCHRVGSSSVDREIPSFENQFIVQCKHSGEREQRVCNICKFISSSAHSQKFCIADSKVPSPDSTFKSENVVGNDNVESSEAKCMSCTSSVLGSCSETSFDVDNMNKTLSRGPLGEELRISQHDNGKPDEQKVCLSSECSHKSLKSHTVLSAERINNKSNLSKCSTFLVRVGEEDNSSALVIQPLAPSQTVHFKDEACQVSDDSICTSPATPANWAECGTSEISVASSFWPTALETENLETADERNQKPVRLYEAVTCERPTSKSGECCESFSSITDSVNIVSNRSRCRTKSGSSRKKRKSPKVSRSRSSSINISDGVCEISHSGCETCQKDASLYVSDAAAASVLIEDKLSMCSEPQNIDHINEKAENVVNKNDTRHPLNIVDLQTMTQTDEVLSQKIAFSTTTCTDVGFWATKNLLEKNSTTTSDDPVCELDLHRDSILSAAELHWCNAPVRSVSSNVDDHFQRERTPRVSTMPVTSCNSSHVDPSSNTTYTVSTSLIELCHSDASVDCVKTDDESYDTDIRTVFLPGIEDLNGPKRTESDSLSESSDPSLQKADETIFRNLHLNPENPISVQFEPDCAGGDTTFPVDFPHCQLKGIQCLATECSNTRKSSESETCCFVSESGILVDSVGSSVHKQPNNSPSSSMDSIGTAAIMSSPSVENSNLSSSPVDPYLSLCSTAEVLSKYSGSVTSKLDSETSGSAVACTLEEKSPGTRASLMTEASICVNNSHKDVMSGLGSAVDCNVIDGELRVRRSWSSEQFPRSSTSDTARVRDSWMSLHRLNLNSRATRLAIESRVQSLQRILNRIESCTRLPLSEQLASEQKTLPHSTSSTVTAATTATAAAETAAPAAASSRDHWLRACSSEELVKIIRQQLQGLKTSSGQQKPPPQSGPLPDVEVCDNNNNRCMHNHHFCHTCHRYGY